MNASRLLGTGILIGVILAALAQELQVERASGIVTSYSTMTSYSTWTSTFYSYSYPTTSTRFSTTTATTDALTQTGPDGLFVAVTGNWGVFVDGQIEFDMTIKNLINLNIQSGIVQFEVKGLKVHRDDIELTFKAIRRGESINVRQLIGLPGATVGAKVTPLSVRVNLSQREDVVMVTAVETYTRTGTVTETYRKTVVNTYVTTSAYTIEERQPVENTQLIIGLVVMAVAAIAGVAFLRTRRAGIKPKAPKTGPQPQIEPAKPPTRPVPEPKAAEARAAAVKGVKYCIHCGAAIPDVVSFCTKCGQKQ